MPDVYFATVDMVILSASAGSASVAALVGSFKEAIEDNRQSDDEVVGRQAILEVKGKEGVFALPAVLGSQWEDDGSIEEAVDAWVQEHREEDAVVIVGYDDKASSEACVFFRSSVWTIASVSDADPDPEIQAWFCQGRGSAGSGAIASQALRLLMVREDMFEDGIMNDDLRTLRQKLTALSREANLERELKEPAGPATKLLRM